MLKGNRDIQHYRPDVFMDEIATRGGVVVYSTAGSGAALDQSRNLGTYSASSSGKVPIGILMDDMVNVDLTLYKLNQHKSQVQQGGKISLADKGWVLTSNYVGSPTGGQTAYLSSSGSVTPTLDTNGGLVATPIVGRFESSPDEDGYVKLNFNLP